MKGKKFDTGKLRWDLMPTEIEDVVKVLTQGAVKYSPDNWKRVPDAPDRYFAALNRHLWARRRGKIRDKHSRMPHMAHVVCNALFLLYFDRQALRAKGGKRVTKKG